MVRKSEMVPIPNKQTREYHKAGRKQKRRHTPIENYPNMASGGKELHNRCMARLMWSAINICKEHAYSQHASVGEVIFQVMENLVVIQYTEREEPRPAGGALLLITEDIHLTINQEP